MSDSLANEACGKPGARIATLASSFVLSGVCSRKTFCASVLVRLPRDVRAADAGEAVRERLHRDERAVLLRAGLDALDRSRPVAGGEELLSSRQHHLHRHAKLLRQPTAPHTGDAEAELAAEAAAHVLDDRRDVRLLQPEHRAASPGMVKVPCVEAYTVAEFPPR
ncbi:MAG: hypothetical protein QM702_03365 [Rubrivivax sp.]